MAPEEIELVVRRLLSIGAPKVSLLAFLENTLNVTEFSLVHKLASSPEPPDIVSPGLHSAGGLGELSSPARLGGETIPVDRIFFGTGACIKNGSAFRSASSII